MRRPIGVGMIGANPDRGWAHDAHIPALRMSPDFELRALCTSNADSAARAGSLYGVSLAYDDAETMLRRPEVDLAVVNVRVPRHADLVKLALKAGKHVLCEWPLARDAAEAQELVALAEAAGVRTFIGLQARASPTIRYVRDLICDGFIGEVLAVTLNARARVWGAPSASANAYTLQRANAATLLSIPFGHGVDALCWCVGEIESLSASMAVQQRKAIIAETGALHPKDTEDQIALSGVLAGGASISVHFRTASVRAPGLYCEINGADGDLIIRGSSGHMQFADLTLEGGRGAEESAPMAIPTKYRLAPNAPAGPPHNVSELYAIIARDLTHETHTAPGFEDALIRHRLIEGVRNAAERGRRVDLPAARS